MKNKFTTYGQCIYDARTHQIHSVELLSRPTDGSDIDVEAYFANASGDELTEYFNHQIGEAIDFYRETGIEPHVNIDLRTFENITQSGKWEHEAQDVEFTLEVTQVQGLPDSELIEMIRDPKNFPSLWPWKGLKVALDDYDINNYYNTNLNDYNFDIVKLDKSLLYASETDHTLHTRIGKIKNSISSEFIVEGVENIYQSMMLVHYGCYLHQGYFYHKPEPLEDLIKRIEKNNKK